MMYFWTRELYFMVSCTAVPGIFDTGPGICYRTQGSSPHGKKSVLLYQTARNLDNTVTYRDHKAKNMNLAVRDLYYKIGISPVQLGPAPNH
jgi:hypothetical protein